MRLVSYFLGNEYRVAGVRNDELVDLAATDPSLPNTMRGLLALGARGLERARAAIAVGQGLYPDSVVLLCPRSRSGKSHLHWSQLCRPRGGIGTTDSG